MGAFTAMTKLRVWASDNDGVVATFKHPNDTQGIGIRYDGLVALGTTANQNIIMRPRGTGGFSVEYGGVSKFIVSSIGGLSIPPDIAAITSGGGGRTYYINNGPSLYWGYGTGDTHTFRNSGGSWMENGEIDSVGGTGSAAGAADEHRPRRAVPRWLPATWQPDPRPQTDIGQPRWRILHSWVSSFAPEHSWSSSAGASRQ